jgi:hypothetical protein
VNSELSDVTGVVAFNLIEGKEYYFVISKSGYETKSISLTPTFATYTVLLVPIITYNPVIINDDVYIQKLGYNLNATGLSWYALRFQSALGQLDDYEVNISWDGGSESLSGSTATGSVLNVSFNITSLSEGNILNISYGYKSTMNADWVYLSESLFVFFPVNPNFFKNASAFFDDYGSIERVLIGSIIMIFITAIFAGASFSNSASVLPMSAVGAFFGAGVVTYIGLFTWPIFIIVGFVFGMILLSKVGGSL